MGDEDGAQGLVLPLGPAPRPVLDPALGFDPGLDVSGEPLAPRVGGGAGPADAVWYADQQGHVAVLSGHRVRLHWVALAADQVLLRKDTT